MAFFTSKIIQGVTYTLGHLDPFSFSIAIEGKKRIVAVRFSLHCFTEGLTPRHSPDLRYTHNGEIRAFDFDRHILSKLLPTIIQTLGNRSVYLSQLSNYFVLRQNPATGFIGPYLVFFNVVKAKEAGIDVLMNVESAYIKLNMAERAAPVKFTTLIEKTATGQEVPRGPLQTIKRK